MAALSTQDFPLDCIEVILVGSEAQVKGWNATYASTPFHNVRTVARDGVRYYELKNAGGSVATGEIIAFTDSDVQPGNTWVSAIVRAIWEGADVSVGASQFHKTEGFKLGPDNPIMCAAASLTWGWILGKRRGGAVPEPRGFMDHNMAMRADLFRDHCYRTEFGRIIASGILFRSMVNSGLRVSVCPMQQAAHHFSWRYWLISLHFRYGYEVYRLRRLDQDYPNQWIRRTGFLEPLFTLAWHMMLDVPRWFRFTGLQGSSAAYRWGFFPVLLVMSAVARTSEAVGMTATMIAPGHIRRWAENV